MKSNASTARLLVEKSKISVILPGKITERDYRIVHDSVFERIRDLTGCACLSGVIDVLIRGDFEDVLEVELPSA